MIVWGVLHRALPIHSTFGDLYFIGSDSGIKHLKQKGVHLIFPQWKNSWIRSNVFDAVLNFGVYPRLILFLFCFLDYLSKIFNTLHDCHPSSAVCSHQFNFWWPVCNFTFKFTGVMERWNHFLFFFFCSYAVVYTLYGNVLWWLTYLDKIAPKLLLSHWHYI